MTEAGAIRFAERVLALLEDGQFTATYKYAVLLGLLDLCLEHTDAHGEAPSTVTTRQLAEKVVELYWPHTVPYARRMKSEVLRQNAGRAGAQAEIIRRIAQFRERLAEHGPGSSLLRLRHLAHRAYDRLLDAVEWKLIEMPLPRLQVVGNIEDRFIYEIGWDTDVRRPDVRVYQRGTGEAQFDNRVLLRPGVGEYLLQLNRLLRPIIHRRWAQMVARLNDLEEARLERFLFGGSRLPMGGLRPGLRDLQDDRCLYCQRRLREAGQVDHFIPWSRYPEDGLANLVLAHGTCNQRKSDFLAAGEHVARWRQRLDAPGLLALAEELRWEAHEAELLSVARATYLRLPTNAVLWLRGREFERADLGKLRACLS